MDAFSLSLAYGTLNLSKHNMRLLSIIVGIYHFIMPLLGLCVGKTLLYFIPIDPNIIVFVVLLFIGIEMVIDSFKKMEPVTMMSVTELLLFGLAVSIDSFSVGIGLKSITSHYIISALTFSLSSFCFTYLGLILGKKISNLIGKLATFLGGIVLIFIGFLYLF